MEKPVRENFAQAETEAKDEPQNNEPADDIQVDELVIAEKPKKFKRPGTPKNIFRASTVSFVSYFVSKFVINFCN